MKAIVSVYLILVFHVSLITVDAQVHRIKPSVTQSDIEDVHGAHVVRTPEPGKMKKRLLISIAGTGASAEGMEKLDSMASLWGYHTISLDYKNNVITTVCRASLDSLCFDSFRQEIVFGTPMSDSVRVDSTNSIYNRLFMLLQYLTKKHPQEGWSAFFGEGRINWSSIAVAGHSQGAGHAAYLGKYFWLDKVLMLAGPQDFTDRYQRPARWIARTSKTFPGRYFALLHENDPYNATKQQASDFILSQSQKLIIIKPGEVSRERVNVYIIRSVTDSPHGAMMELENAPVWKMLLER